MHEEEPEAADAALISRVRAGDTGAYGTLCERHAPAARGLARHLADGDAAEDAVQEALAKILDLLRRGGGPDSGFRPYLLTAVRRAVYDRHRADRRVHPTDRIDDLDRGTPFEDPAVRDLERSMVLGAFHSLPERWQTVLWHTEIEGARPADVAPLLGLTPNGAAALAYRAREGLRQAYLQMHLAALPDERRACREAVDKLGAFVRDGLARRDTRRVRGHLDGCAACTAVHAELAALNSTLREVLGPLVLGAAATAYLATGGGLFGWPAHLPRRGRQALGGGAAAVACAVALAMALVSNDAPSPEPRPAPPAVALPAPADPAAPPPAPSPPPGPAPSRPVVPVPAAVLEPLPVPERVPEPPPAEPAPERPADAPPEPEPEPEPEREPEPEPERAAPIVEVDTETEVPALVRTRVRVDVRVPIRPADPPGDLRVDVRVDVRTAVDVQTDLGATSTSPRARRGAMRS
ncbi:hypothetical protein GCM10010182_41210 [Actinomadura cremea]|nr:hypothetical protein GCM10010182_41210 [Actinomadura cremea]